jgi:fimbrial chaperone protein
MNANTRARVACKRFVAALIKTIMCGMLATGLALSSAMAGEFTISPIRIFMSPTDRAVAVTITNESDEPLTMEVDLYNWSQTETGEEQLELSEDIFMSPPVMTLQPRERQVVRLARLSNAPPPEQLTYRLIAREILPEPGEDFGGGQVQLALALSLPIFITPRDSMNDVVCALQNMTPEPPRILCENTGTAYAQLRELQVSSADGQELLKLEAAKYILPGAKASFNLPEGIALPAGANMLNVTMDDDVQLKFALSSVE